MSLRDLQADSIGGVSKRVGSAAVLGAHGNAGVLISQILRGIAKGLAGNMMHHLLFLENLSNMVFYMLNEQ